MHGSMSASTVSILKVVVPDEEKASSTKKTVRLRLQVRVLRSIGGLCLCSILPPVVQSSKQYSIVP